MSYEQYLGKIAKYRVLDDGSIINDEGKLILLYHKLWNNNYTNKDLTALDWKFIDYGKDFLVSEDDWCFIDDDLVLEDLLNWFNKLGTSEKQIRNNIMSILENYKKKEFKKNLLYNQDVGDETNQEQLKQIYEVYESINEDDVSLLQKLGDNQQMYDKWNTIISEAVLKTSEEQKEDELSSLNHKLQNVSESLNKTKDEIRNMNINAVKTPKQQKLFESLTKTRESLISEKQEILTAIDKYNEQKRERDLELSLAVYKPGQEDLSTMLEKSEVIKKLAQMNNALNEILNNLVHENVDDLRMNYSNGMAMKFFKKNIQNGLSDVKKSKKKATNSYTVRSLNEIMEEVREELRAFESTDKLL